MQCFRAEGVIAIAAAVWEMNPEKRREDFTAEVERRPWLAASDFGGEPTAEMRVLMRDQDAVYHFANPERRHPIREDGTFEDWFIGDGETPHFVHLDLSENRCSTGVCMSHWDVERDVVVLDLIHEIIPPDGGSVDYEALRRTIFLLDKRSFMIDLITLDKFMSLEMINKLEGHGFLVELYSVDKSTEAYDTFLELLLAGSLDYYAHPTLCRQVNTLFVRGRKVFAQGLKDVSDAAAGSVRQCFEYEAPQATEAAVGAVV